MFVFSTNKKSFSECLFFTDKKTSNPTSRVKRLTMAWIFLSVVINYSKLPLMQQPETNKSTICKFMEVLLKLYTTTIFHNITFKIIQVNLFSFCVRERIDS